VLHPVCPSVCLSLSFYPVPVPFTDLVDTRHTVMPFNWRRPAAVKTVQLLELPWLLQVAMAASQQQARCVSRCTLPGPVWVPGTVVIE